MVSHIRPPNFLSQVNPDELETQLVDLLDAMAVDEPASEVAAASDVAADDGTRRQALKD